MTEVSRNITVDLSRKGGTRPIFAVQNDVGARNLTVRITDDGSPYKIEAGTTAALNYKRPDGVSGAIMMTVGDGEVSVNLPPVVIGVKGVTVCTVSLFDADKNKLTSSEFCLDVSEELYSGEAIDATPEYALLESLFSRVSEIELDEIQRQAAESEREIAEGNRETAENARNDGEIERAKAESERSKAESAREEAELMRDKRMSGRIGEAGSVVLKSTAWSSDCVQKVSVSGLCEDDLVMFYPASADDREYIGYYGVFISPEATGESFTVSARAKPISDISLKYYVVRGRLPKTSEVE